MLAITSKTSFSIELSVDTDDGSSVGTTMFLEDQEITFRAQFRNAAGHGVDPDYVTCILRRPDGTTVSVATVSDGGGAFHSAHTPERGTAGTWLQRWAGYGGVRATKEEAFIVATPHIRAPDPTIATITHGSGEF